MRKLLALTILGAAVSFNAQASNFCDDINDVANGWNDVANFINEHRDSEWDDESIGYLIEAVTALHGGSTALADLLVSQGNGSERQVGQALQRQLTDVAQLTTASPVDTIISELDQVTDSMDQVTNLCDAS